MITKQDWSTIGTVLDGIAPENLYVAWQMLEGRLQSTAHPEVHIVTEAEAEHEESTQDEGDVICPVCGEENSIVDADASIRWCALDWDHDDKRIDVSSPDNENHTTCFLCESCSSPVSIPEGYEEAWD